MRKPQLPSENDILFAYKALSIAPGLSNAARQVAGALIDHFNRNGGRCDPSVERLAKLLEMHRATILRATAELTKKGVGLFEKSSHGGYHNTASYQPKWHRFRKVVEEWKFKMQGDKPRENVAEMRPSTSQDCDVDGRKTATQTNLINQSKNQSNNIHEQVPKKANEGTTDKQPQTQVQTDSRSKGQLKKGSRRRTERPKSISIHCGKSPSHDNVVKLKAAERIDAWLNRLDGNRYVEFVTNVSGDSYDQAVIAECAMQGAGMAHLQAEIGRCAHG